MSDFSLSFWVCCDFGANSGGPKLVVGCSRGAEFSSQGDWLLFVAAGRSSDQLTARLN